MFSLGENVWKSRSCIQCGPAQHFLTIRRESQQHLSPALPLPIHVAVVMAGSHLWMPKVPNG